MNALDAALTYCAAGWPVFPCGRETGKAPLTEHGFHDATTSRAIVSAWWARWPEATIGVPTGAETFDVLDVDVKPEGTGFPALGRLARAGLVAGAFRMVHTPSGGVHLYFRPSGNGNTTRPLDHLDVRGDGGYVIVPPSVINGRAYVTVEDRPDATGRLDWPACARLLDPPRPVRSAQRAGAGSVAGLVAWLAGQAPVRGARNAQLFWACCRAVEDHGADGADLVPLVEAGRSLGLSEAECRATARSALTRSRAGAA